MTKTAWLRAACLALSLAAAIEPGGVAAQPAVAADAPAAAASGASASSPAPADAALQTQLGAIRALRQRRPGDGLLVYYEAMTLSQLGDVAAAMRALRTLAGRRLGLVPAPDAGFDALWSDVEFQALRKQLGDDEPRVADAPTVLTIADAGLVPEGIAYDARRGVHYIGSIARRKIVAVDRGGRARDFSSKADALDAVLGLAVDARRRRLCAVSTNGFEVEGEKNPRNRVVCWSLAGKRVVAQVSVPAARQLNDLAIARDGTVYVTDSAAGSLYRWTPGRDAVDAVVAEGALRGANGVAAAGDGSAVYVTLSTGIARVDSARGTFERLAQPDDIVSGGIDGLYWHDGDLVGVQNVTNPGRVVRLALADDGRRIAGLTVLQSHHHAAFVEPTTGAIVGHRLHVIANSHVASYRPDGTLRDAKALRPPQIVAVPLRR